MGVVQEDQVNQTKKVASIMMIKICVGVSAHIKTTQYISIFVTLRTPAPMKTIAMLAVTVIVGTRGLDQQQTHAYLRLLVIWIFHPIVQKAGLTSIQNATKYFNQKRAGKMPRTIVRAKEDILLLFILKRKTTLLLDWTLTQCGLEGLMSQLRVAGGGVMDQHSLSTAGTLDNQTIFFMVGCQNKIVFEQILSRDLEDLPENGTPISVTLQATILSLFVKKVLPEL